MARKTCTQPARNDDSGRILVTRGFLAETTDRHPEIVARHCRAVACDVRNRALLYDVDEAAQVLGQISRTHRIGQAVDRLSQPVVPFRVQSCAQNEGHMRQTSREPDTAAAAAKPRRPASRPPIVYYLRVGALVKIGYTTDLNSRLLVYPPDSVVLATEPGGRDLERSRHLQFAADLAHGREWFRPSPALIQHINALRAQPLTPAELAA